MICEFLLRSFAPICLAVLIGACSNIVASCESRITELHPLAQQSFGEGVVVFDQAGDKSSPIQAIYYSARSGCSRNLVDEYPIEGSAPNLEATFVYPVRGQTNLFAIVSWRLDHPGLGTKGLIYYVYAYNISDDVLSENELVTKNKDVYAGIVGTSDGEPSTFEGTTREGVIKLLIRNGLN